MCIRDRSSIVLRFKADNPGVWFFHCHIEWHLKQGLALLLIEAPEEMQNTESQQLTDNHKQVCENVGLSWEGNAAGNTNDFLDLVGQNVQVANIPDGFTAKGIVAMTFSCLAGVLGLISLSTYGLMGVKKSEEEIIRDLGMDPDAVEKVDVSDINSDEDSSRTSKNIE